MKKFLSAFIICALCTCSFVWADYATVSDLEAQFVETEDEEFFIDIDDAWHPISALYVDEDGFCYLQTSKKHKRYESSEESDDSEMACILGCPDCGRVQSCRLFANNKGRCSSCRQIFPAGAFYWKCTNCGTKNYLNPERCGWPPCRCSRDLCDPDVKNNINSPS